MTKRKIVKETFLLEWIKHCFNVDVKVRQKMTSLACILDHSGLWSRTTSHQSPWRLCVDSWISAQWPAEYLLIFYSAVCKMRLKLASVCFFPVWRLNCPSHWIPVYIHIPSLSCKELESMHGSINTLWDSKLHNIDYNKEEALYLLCI